ncbi:MAG: phytanoyl-CoA dioxygenase family protein [Candidatus Omnitrophica bacterium]|nr:phytanoyl-CoA dioxygenase family protein [Candidatus Omnitrophota bacterium]
MLGPSAKPVKGILFDKGEAANWSVRWHQDTTISVKQKIETPGFEAWSHKDDVPHVRPPVEIMERIVAFRIHLDDCGEENGPLKVLAGSHRRGYLSREEVLRLMKEEPPVPCTARKGDVLLMRPLIVHSSSRSRSPAHRRVIHIEYSAENLPNGLEWFES